MTDPTQNARHQAAYRARKAAAQLTEVRGIFAHPDDHQAIKEHAAKLARKRAKTTPAKRAAPSAVLP